MKKRTITAIAATILAAAASFAHGETAAPPPQRTERAAQFADRFATLQGIASNSSAFMQHASGTNGSTGSTAGSSAERMAGPHDDKMLHSAIRANANPRSVGAAAMQHDATSHDGLSEVSADETMRHGSAMRAPAAR